MASNLEHPIVSFNLNIPQARFHTVMANESWLLMGRGTGKTVGCDAPWILRIVLEMARSSGALICQSFSDGESKILNPLFMAFEMLGHQKDVHFVYGCQPPKSWAKPYIPIIDYKHVVSFPNGTTMELISLHLKGSANSHSFQWIVGPEAKFFNEEQLRGEVFPTLRGNVPHFGHSALYGAKLFETDKLSANIHWILEKRKLHDENLVQTVIYYQLQVNELRMRRVSASESTAYKLQAKILQIEQVLNVLRKRMVYVGEASSLDNLANLKDDYIENMRRSLTPYEFDVAILNKDPTKVENGFYPDLTAHHKYLMDGDDDTSRPLAIAADYQGSISPIVSCQVNDLVVPGQYTLNFLKDFYVKHPYGMKQTVDRYCDYYKHRPCKHVYFFYDHTAVGERNGHRKLYEEVTDFFKENGWRVTGIYMGQAWGHNLKYARIKHYLSNTNSSPWQIRMHSEGCNATMMSMDLAGVEHSTKHGTQKDKKPEKNKKFPQELATHFSDVFDMLIQGILEQGLYPSVGSAGRVQRLGVR